MCVCVLRLKFQLETNALPLLISFQRWSRFAWDLEAVMGISSALGGFPAPDYCMLICPQFNSPLYCDSDHPQNPLPDFGKSQRNRGYVRKQAAAVPGLPALPRDGGHAVPHALLRAVRDAPRPSGRGSAG